MTTIKYTIHLCIFSAVDDAFHFANNIIWRWEHLIGSLFSSLNHSDSGRIELENVCFAFYY